MLSPLRLLIDPFSNDTSPPYVDLSLVKKHCRVDFTDDDDLINAYIDAGVLWVENTTDRTIFPRAHKWVLSGFPDGRVKTFQLPRGLTQSVASVKYTSGGVLTTLDPADYQTDLSFDSGGVLYPTYGLSWPTTDEDALTPVEINFTAGYTDVPQPLMSAIWLSISDAYDMRGASDLSQSLASEVGERFMAREALVSQYRLGRVY